jgi:hypothetical protein
MMGVINKQVMSKVQPKQSVDKPVEEKVGKVG